jgi:hypothetical protein
MRKLRHTVVCVLCTLGLALPLELTGVTVAQAATSANLIKNPGAEAAPGSPDGSVVPVPKWTELTGTTFTAVQYGATGGFPAATSPGPAKRGKNFFAGGPGTDSITAVQTISLAKYLTAIKAGKAQFSASAWLGGFGSQNDSGFVEMDWKNASGSLVGTSAILGPVTAADRGNVTGLLLRTTSGKVPKGARSVFVQLSLFPTTGTYNDGFADNVSLKITTP